MYRARRKSETTSLATIAVCRSEKPSLMLGSAALTRTPITPSTTISSISENPPSRRREGRAVAVVDPHRVEGLAGRGVVEIAEALPLRLIDCQIYTDHLASLGAREISRTHFQRTLEVALARPATALGALPRCRADALRWAA